MQERRSKCLGVRLLGDIVSILITTPSLPPIRVLTHPLLLNLLVNYFPTELIARFTEAVMNFNTPVVFEKDGLTTGK